MPEQNTDIQNTNIATMGGNENNGVTTKTPDINGAQAAMKTISNLDFPSPEELQKTLQEAFVKLNDNPNDVQTLKFIEDTLTHYNPTTKEIQRLMLPFKAQMG